MGKPHERLPINLNYLKMLRSIASVKPLGGKKATGQLAGTASAEEIARLRQFWADTSEADKLPKLLDTPMPERVALCNARRDIHRRAWRKLYPHAAEKFAQTEREIGLPDLT